MEFPVSWNLAQLGLSESLLHEIVAAEILERHGYRTCIVGDLATVVYGSDVAISDVYIAVADDALESALETLLEEGYIEAAQTYIGFRDLGPVKDCSWGWPGYRMRSQTLRKRPLGIQLIPSSLWHLDLNGPSYFLDTLLFPGSMCRFPRIEPYLNALIQTVAHRLTDLYLNFSLTLYVKSQYATMLCLLPFESRSWLPAENRFFIDYFYKMVFPKSKIKFISLWQKIRDGSLSVSDAIASLPRRDMYMQELKAKKAEIARKAADAAGVKVQVQVY